MAWLGKSSLLADLYLISSLVCNRTVHDLGKQLEEKTTNGRFQGTVSQEGQQDIIRIILEINYAIEFAMVRLPLSGSSASWLIMECDSSST